LFGAASLGGYDSRLITIRTTDLRISQSGHDESFAIEPLVDAAVKMGRVG